MRRRRREGRDVSDWEKERREFFENKGFRLNEIEGKEEEEGWFSKMRKVDRNRQRKEWRERSKNSEYNRWYWRVKGEGVPGYIKKGWGKVDDRE